jgi:hypothetical protein
LTVTITVPDTNLARGATLLARSVEPVVLVEHSFRTFHMGAALLSGAGKHFDAEILYVASMLHDIALGTDLDDGVTPFNLRGASLAARHVLDQGSSDADAQLVYDAIRLHLDLETARHEVPEVAGVHIGAAADVVGLNVDDIPPAVLEEVLAQHPRDGMKAALVALMEAEAARKPYSESAALVHNLGFVQLINAAPFEG